MALRTSTGKERAVARECESIDRTFGAIQVGEQSVFRFLQNVIK